jgi:hypothetical protein
MDNQGLLLRLKQLDACEEALKWVGTRSTQQAWDECTRPDWLIWVMLRMGEAGWPPMPGIYQALCDCLEIGLQSLSLIPTQELLQKVELRRQGIHSESELAAVAAELGKVPGGCSTAHFLAAFDNRLADLEGWQLARQQYAVGPVAGAICRLLRPSTVMLDIIPLATLSALVTPEWSESEKVMVKKREQAARQLCGCIRRSFPTIP